jgi:alpha-glucosidase
VFSLVVAAQAGPVDLTSPDGAVHCTLSTDAEGHLVYSVTQGGQARLEPARAGVIIENVDFGATVALGEPRTRSISEVFPWRGNKSMATNHCRAFEIPIRTQAGVNWTLEVRVFNDGVGFRYRVPGTGTRRIQGESTRWQLPKDCTVWFQTGTVNYEGVYQSARADQMPLEKEVGKEKRPVHVGLPMTAIFPDGTFGLVSEAALYRYSGLTLRPEGGAQFRAAFEDDPDGWPQDGIVLSPWRVIVLGKDLNAIVNSDVIAALCEPPDPKLFPAGLDTPWLRPGKSPCTWMVFGNDGARWDRQKWFVDVAAATGCEYLLVDGGWETEKWGWLKDGGDPWERAAELCRYAAERKVGILLWHAFSDGHDEGPGLTTTEAQEQLFQNCQKAVVKGVKIDFVDSESRAIIEVYEDLLRRAAKYQIMVNFHGANKPTGEMRTWPNEMTREGIHEQEYLLWSSLPLPHYGALPFTRMAAGHGDFLPGYVQPKFLKNTTAIFQMASVIVFSTPLLCWPDNPEAYLNSPLLQFVRTVPVTWDETRILPGSVIGDTVIMARRKGVEWFVAVLNCRPEPRDLDLDLSSLGLAAKECTLYRDGADKPAFSIEAGVKPPGDGKFTVSLRPGGGFMAHLYPPKESDGGK